MNEDVKASIRHYRYCVCMAGIPGLIHFGRKPKHIPIFSSVVSLKLQLPSRSEDDAEMNTFHLDGLRLSTESRSEDCLQTAILSSVHSLSGPADGLLKMQPIHTHAERAPYWKGEFSSPLPLIGISIFNRNDLWSWRAYQLCVEALGENGECFLYDNLGEVEILKSLDGFVAGLMAAQVDLGFLDLSQCLPSMYRLTKALSKAIRSGTCDVAQLLEERLKLIANLVEAVEHLQNWQLRLALTYVTPLFEALVDRAFNENYPHGHEVEYRAAALSTASHFLHLDILDSGYIKENEKFLFSAKQLTLFEGIINDVYCRANSTVKTPNIMFRAHHISNEDLREKSDKLLNSIIDLVKILSDLGYCSAICYGTLLGAVRDGNFIPHDDDIDLVVSLNARTDEEALREMEQLVAELKRLGLDAGMYPNNSFMWAVSSKGGERADIFPVIGKDGTKVRMYMEDLKIRDVPANCVLPFEDLNFLGEKVPCPRNPDQFLSERYGQDWMTPVRYAGGLMLR